MVTLARRRNILNVINDIPLNYKFLLIFVLCVLMPILTINFILLDKISKDAKDREKENYNISIERARSDITAMIDACIAVSHSISSDRTLYEILGRSFRNDSEFYEVYDNTLRDRLYKYTSIYNHISQLYLYTSNKTIESGGNYHYTNSQTINSQWYKEIQNTDEKIVLYSYRDLNINNSGNYAQYFSIVRKMDQYVSATDKYRHFLKINMDLNGLYEIFDREKSYLKLYLIDNKGRIICSTGRAYEQDLSMNFSTCAAISADRDSIVLERNLGQASYVKGWKLVGIADRNRILPGLKQSRLLIFYLILGSALVSTLLIWVILHSYNHRIKKLSKQMKKVENQQFDLIELAEGKDEIGGLIRSFNLMVTKINSLINDVYKLNIQKKDLEIERIRAELNFLQGQMNPHFLFNTLNAIMAVCVKNNYKDLTEVLKYLSKVLRRLLSWKDDMVTVQEEMSFTEMYLKIEKFRFCEKFNYTVEVSENTLSLKVPKMSIQTLVENACKHGIQSRIGAGIVRIRIEQKDGFLCVEVEDNGSGMDKDKLIEIQGSLLDDSDFNGSFGIRNVYKRLHLYYGDRVDFQIDSLVDRGTRVYFKINVQNNLRENTTFQS